MTVASVVDLVEGDPLLYQGGTPPPSKECTTSFEMTPAFFSFFFVFRTQTNT